MSILRRAMRWNTGTVENNPWFIPTNSMLSGSSAVGSADSALQLAAVYSCVRLIATVVSGIPMVAYDDSNKPLDSQPVIVDNPFGGEDAYDTATLSRREGIRQVVMSLLLRGNAYMMVVEGTAADPQLVMPIDPGRVTPPAGVENFYRVDGEPIRDSEIIHVRGLTLPGSRVGMSPLEYARRTIELGVAAEEFGAQFFRQGTTMSGVIEVEADLSREQAKKLKEQFEASHAGLGNALRVGILSAGAKFAPVTVTAEDAQFLGTQAAKTLDIAMLYGVPPHMIGQVDRTTSWGKGIEEQTRGFIAYTIKGWTDPLEDLWTRLCGPGKTVRFDFGELLRPDISARMVNHQIERTIGLRTIDEIRVEEGFEPLDTVVSTDLMAPLNSAHAMDPGWDGQGDETPNEKNGQEAPASPVTDSEAAPPA